MSKRRPKPSFADIAIWQKGQQIKELRLDDGTYRLGRDKEMEIPLKSDHVSRHHLTLFVKSGRVRVEDRLSRNGILVNGKRSQRAELRGGDVVAVADFEIRILARSTDKEPLVAGSPDASGSPLRGGWDSYFNQGANDHLETPASGFEKLEKNRSPRQPVWEESAISCYTGASWSPLADRQGRRAIYLDGPSFYSAEGGGLESSSLLNGGSRRPTAGMTARGRVLEIIICSNSRVKDVFHLPPDTSLCCDSGTLVRGRSDSGGTRLPLITHRKSRIELRVLNGAGWRVRSGEQLVESFAESEQVVLQELRPDLCWQLIKGERVIHIRSLEAIRPLPKSLALMPSRPSRGSMVGFICALLIHFNAAFLLSSPESSVASRLERKTAEFVDFSFEPEPPTTPQVLEPAEVAPPKDELQKIEPREPKRTRRRRPSRVSKGKQILGRAKEDFPREGAAAAEPTSNQPAVPKAEERPQPAKLSVADFKISTLVRVKADSYGETEKTSIRQILRSRGRGRLVGGALTMARGDSPKGSPGSLSDAAVADVVNQDREAVQRCYERLLKRQFTAEGSIVLSWRVNVDGSVTWVRVTEDSVGAPSLVRCLKRLVRGWDFSKPTGGAAVVNFPFSFQRP